MDINEIARLAGVSRATVSRYLNNGYVSQEKRSLIARIIEETGYVPSHQAQQLRTGKTNLVGVIIPTLNSQSVSRMVTGITDVLSQCNYQVLLASTGNNEKTELDYMRIFSEKHYVAGIILLATVITEEHLAAIKSINIPVVILGQEVVGHDCVFHDDYRATYDITMAVLKNGKQPGFIGVIEEDFAAGHMRHQGFLDACAACGITPKPEAQAIGDFTMDSGFFCCEQILENASDVDTIVCATDTVAFGAMTCLREFGYRVPEDVQVTGIGDSEFSRAVIPALTTAHFFYKTSGANAAILLISKMERRHDVPSARALKMGYDIYIRTSTR